MDDATAELLLTLVGDGLPTRGRPRWHANAACRGAGTELFFHDSRHNDADDEAWREL